MFSEEDLLPLSGISHMAFCSRRWALIHIECAWEDNRFTAEGTLAHEKAHSGEVESRPGVLIRRTLPVLSFRLGLSGQADIVEFQPVQHGGIVLPGREGRWQPGQDGEPPIPHSALRSGAVPRRDAQCRDPGGRCVRQYGTPPPTRPLR